MNAIRNNCLKSSLLSLKENQTSIVAQGGGFLLLPHFPFIPHFLLPPPFPASLEEKFVSSKILSVFLESLSTSSEALFLNRSIAVLPPSTRWLVSASSNYLNLGSTIFFKFRDLVFSKPDLSTSKSSTTLHSPPSCSWAPPLPTVTSHAAIRRARVVVWVVYYHACVSLPPLLVSYGYNNPNIPLGRHMNYETTHIVA
jgi:hypothetical protein